jgi:hypothetical protein
MYLKSLCCLSSLATAFMAVEPALAQIPPAPYVAPAPILNPSTSLVLPPPRQVPVSPSLGGPASSGPDSICVAPIRWSIRRAARCGRATSAAIGTRSVRSLPIMRRRAAERPAADLETDGPQGLAAPTAGPSAVPRNPHFAKK